MFKDTIATILRRTLLIIVRLASAGDTVCVYTCIHALCMFSDHDIDEGMDCMTKLLPFDLVHCIN